MRAVVAVLILGACGRIDFDPRADAAAVPDAPRAGRILAVTMTEIYEIDPETLEPTPVLGLCANLTSVPVIADVAFERDGSAVLTTRSLAILRVDATGACTSVPVSQLDLFGLDVVRGASPSDDALIAACAPNSSLYQLDAATGTLQLIGPMGQSVSGDIAWTGSELVMSADGGSGLPDKLAHLDLATGTATIRGTLPYDQILGLAALAGRLYGVASNGAVLEVDITTGAKLHELATGLAWLGASTDLGP